MPSPDDPALVIYVARIYSVVLLAPYGPPLSILISCPAPYARLPTVLSFTMIDANVHTLCTAMNLVWFANCLLVTTASLRVVSVDAGPTIRG